MNLFATPAELQEFVEKLCTRVSALEADILEQDARIDVLESYHKVGCGEVCSYCYYGVGEPRNEKCKDPMDRAREREERERRWDQPV